MKKPYDTYGQLITQVFYGDQSVFQKYIRKNYKCAESNGNFYNIRYKNAPVFIAHMDTVGEKTMNQKLKLKNWVLSRPGHVLGADDRAGAWLILNNSSKINWILCRDEEIGGLGSRALVGNEKFLRRIEEYTPSAGVVLDRAGTGDIIGIHNSYCEADLSDAIAEILPTYRPDVGIFSDADSFNEILPCVNLSVGYAGAHTKNETLDVKHLMWLNKKIPELHKGLSGRHFELADTSDVPKVQRMGSNYPYYCELCNDIAAIEVDGIGFCIECAEYFQRELNVQLSRYDILGADYELGY